MDVKHFILSVILTIILPMEMPGQIADGDSLSAHSAGVENDFVRPNEQGQTCMSFAMAGNFEPASAEGKLDFTLPSAAESVMENRTRGNYKFEWQQTILPVSLLGVGALSLAPSFIRNGSRSVTNSLIDMRGDNKRLVFDNYIQYLPVVTSLMLGCTGVNARHSLKDRAFILATSYAALAVLTNVPKWCIDEKRPEFAAHNSFPSGHTATAFMGAELVRIEYGGWSAVGAYAVASGVAILRMYNGRHWLHDVVAGAGVGILCARIGEWSCPLWNRVFQKRGKENNVQFSPMASPVGGGYYGFALNCCF